MPMDSGTSLSHVKTFMERLQKFMPHWTSMCKDKITYVTITEALSSSCVECRILLKKDLHIEELNFPANVVVLACEAIMNMLAHYI